MLSFWVEMDLDPDGFWSQTPRLFKAIIAGKQKALERDFQGRAWLAWHTAVLGKVAKIPPLSDLTGVRPQSKKMTPAEFRAAFASMRESSSTT